MDRRQFIKAAVGSLVASAALTPVTGLAMQVVEGERERPLYLVSGRQFNGTKKWIFRFPRLRQASWPWEEFNKAVGTVNSQVVGVPNATEVFHAEPESLLVTDFESTRLDKAYWQTDIHVCEQLSTRNWNKFYVGTATSQPMRLSNDLYDKYDLTALLARLERLSVRN